MGYFRECDKRSPCTTEPCPHATPFGYSGIPAETHRGESYPATPIGVYSVQRRLRR